MIEKALFDFSEEEQKEIYRDVANNYGLISNSVIAQRWGLSQDSVARIAQTIRKHGIPLPRYVQARAIRMTDGFIDELTEIVMKRIS